MTGRNRFAQAVWFLALAASVALAGCNRSPRFVPQQADSTAAGIDSSRIRIRQAQTLWENSGSGAEAAALTARIVAERVAAIAPDAWKASADLLLDSLGVGFESVAGDCGLAINFFARSDPASGSWPYLFVCSPPGQVHHQAIEGRDLKLVDFAARGLPPAARPSGASGDAPPDPPGAAVLFARRVGSGQQPVLMAWRPAERPRDWRLTQTLGPDSLGGVGTGTFVATPEGSIELQTRTYRPPAFFAECATCPHLHKIRRFVWTEERFVRAAPDSVAPSPYATFVTFIHALVTNDRDQAEELVVNRDVIDRAYDLQWSRPAGAWRVAPSTGERTNPMVFYRGDQEAYRVSFVPRGDAWVIFEIEETARTVE